MKIAVKIWALAIVYQTFMYTFLDGDFEWSAICFFIPAAMIGGLPSLFIYGAILHQLHIGCYPLRKKWLVAFAGAMLAALVNIVLAVLFFEMGAQAIRNSFVPLFLPAPLSALLALCSFALSINEYLNENTAQKNP